MLLQKENDFILNTLVFRYILFVISFLVFSCGNNEKSEKIVKVKDMFSYFELENDDYEYIFVVSQYQCAGCVDSIMRMLASDDFRLVLESSVWISPYEKPNCFTNLNVSQWQVIDQKIIERFIPYAANITYIKRESRGVSEYKELGVEMLEKDKLEKLFHQ